MLPFSIQAQNCSVQLSGTVSDIDTKQPLENATVFIKELNQSVISDVNGFYRFTNLCGGNYTIIVTHISCIPIELKIKLEKQKMNYSKKININL